MNSDDIVTRIHPERAPAENRNTDRAPSRNRAQSPRRSYRNRRYERNLWRIKMLGGALAVTLLILMVLAKFEIEALESENSNLVIKSRKQEVMLQNANEHVDKLRDKVQVLVKGRIPNLHRLEFDQTIPLNQPYLRSIIFNLTGVESDKQYEYRMVMHNDSMSASMLLVNVFLFDELGIQVGSTRNTESNAMDRVEYVGLQPGETRSYSSMVPLERNEKPYYFFVTIE